MSAPCADAVAAPLPVEVTLTPTRRVGTVFVVGLGVWSLYAFVGAWTARGPLYEAGTALDRAVPMQPAWVLVYLLIFFLAAAPVAAVRDVRALDRALGAYLSLYVVAVPIWILFPVTVPRAPLPITDLWSFGIALTRYVDPPTNCMPSMHVALSVMAALVVWRLDRAMGAALSVAAALVTWSTVAIEQHWVADGLVAAALAFGADHVWFRRRPLPAAALAPLPRAWHLTWVGAYVVVTLVLMSGWWLGWMPLDVLPPNAERW